MLVCAVVGSGIMGDRLSAGNTAIALLANSIATGAALIVLIMTFGPVSGAHFNPVVTLCDYWTDGVTGIDSVLYVAAQFVGGLGGVVMAHAMFSEPLFQLSPHVRTGAAQWLSEAIATFGLLSVIWGVTKSQPKATAFAVGSYITGAYWFTSSTSFANPAVTLARAFTATFTGIRALDVPAFIVAQVVGAAAATALFRWLLPITPTVAKHVIEPRNFS
jgi:glycerol uptake facilitator-like aquaporin